jgi:hypothetical protein
MSSYHKGVETLLVIGRSDSQDCGISHTRRSLKHFLNFHQVDTKAVDLT